MLGEPLWTGSGHRSQFSDGPGDQFKLSGVVVPLPTKLSCQPIILNFKANVCGVFFNPTDEFLRSLVLISMTF